VGFCVRTTVHDFDPGAVGASPSTYPTKKNGAPVVASAWNASYGDGCCRDLRIQWNSNTGLLLQYSDARLHSGSSAQLLDTDAPIGVGDPPPKPQPAPAWPAAGSFVTFTSAFTSPYGTTHDNTTWTYTGGYWRKVCDMHYVPNASNPYGGEESNQTFEIVDAQLPMGPLAIAANDRTFTPAGGCDDWVSSVNRAAGKVTENTTRFGTPTSTTAWKSTEFPGESPRLALWQANTGLTLRWRYDNQGDTEWQYVGHLTDTNAPMG
jgi:hypothetical protein